MEAIKDQYEDGQVEMLGIHPPRMPLGYIVETYPSRRPPGYPAAVSSSSVLENNTFIPGKNLRGSTSARAVTRPPALMGNSPIDLTTSAATASPSAGSVEEAESGRYARGPRSYHLPLVLRDDVIMQCEESPEDEDDDEDDAEVLSDASSSSEGVTALLGDQEPTAAGPAGQEGHDLASLDETLFPHTYSEVYTQRSVAYVIGGYAYTKNRQQLDKTYLRCRQRGCGARAMIMGDIRRATVFNNSHNHPAPSDIPRIKARKRRYSLTSLSPGPGPDDGDSSPVGEGTRGGPDDDDDDDDVLSPAQMTSHTRPLPGSMGAWESTGDGVPRIVYVRSLHPSKMTTTAKARLPEFLEKMERELNRVMDFWLKHSHDTVNGGFYTCLGQDGKRYDDLKYCWLQGRQVWMYCKLYNSVPKYHTPEILQAAKKGGQFLRNYVKNPTTGKCYFIVTKDGKAVKVQRTIFSECFYMLAMSELARATNDNSYKQEAVKMLDQLQHWVCVDDTGLGRPQLLGAPRVNSLSRGMIFLNLLDELTAGDPALQERYASLEKWSIEQSLQHMQREGTVILETVSTEGKELAGSGGRLMNPGHAIETGWFLLQCGTKHELAELKKLAAEHFISRPFQTGWDQEHGGLYAFLDADGLPPTQLEWNMKLWWPHCEALIATLMAYRETKEERFLDMFEKVFDYTFSRFVDTEHGEWFGYLSQEGKVTQNFKGGPFKGCFHVPRCLLMCTQVLQKILKGE